MAKCANCDKDAKFNCGGCKDAPEYSANDHNAVVSYCDRDCQKAHWASHKAECNTKQRRLKLARAAELLRATLLAYRECAFDVDIQNIEFRDGTLRLQEGPKSSRKRAFHQPFPSNLTSNKEYREAALTNNQCTLAMAALGPLARSLLDGISYGITQMDVSMEKPIFSTRLVLANGTVVEPPTVPEHTILVVHMKHDENWVIDAAGAQFRFQNTLIPYKEYFEKTQCQDLGKMEPYDATETKDMDHFLTLPFMKQFRDELILERNARLHFAAFVKTKTDRADFSEDMLSGTADEFKRKLESFIEELKLCMSEFVVETYNF